MPRPACRGAAQGLIESLVGGRAGPSQARSGLRAGASRTVHSRPSTFLALPPPPHRTRRRTEPFTRTVHVLTNENGSRPSTVLALVPPSPTAHPPSAAEAEAAARRIRGAGGAGRRAGGRAGPPCRRAFGRRRAISRTGRRNFENQASRERWARAGFAAAISHTENRGGKSRRRLGKTVGMKPSETGARNRRRWGNTRPPHSPVSLSASFSLFCEASSSTEESANRREVCRSPGGLVSCQEAGSCRLGGFVYGGLLVGQGMGPPGSPDLAAAGAGRALRDLPPRPRAPAGHSRRM